MGQLCFAPIEEHIKAIHDNAPIEEHIKAIHGNSKGYICHAEKNPNYRQWHYTKNKLIENMKEIIGNKNQYISQNTFYRTYRRLEYLKQLRNLYIDVDCYKTKYTKDAVLYFLENDYFNKKIPRPNLIMDSGRGLYLIWHIAPASNQAISLWKAIEEYLYKKLEEFGADKKALDPTRVLRVAGTINTKSNTVVEILERYDYEYTLREIQNEYLPELPPDWKERAKKKGRKKKIINLCNTYSLHHARLKDLIKLCESRNWDMEGYRNIVCMLYRYWTCCFSSDTEQALEQVLEFNQQFIKPLGHRAVVINTKSSEKAYDEWATGGFVTYKGKEQLKGYNYTNETLIDLLGITEKEQEHMSTIISKKEKKRRNNEYNKAKQKEKYRNENGLTPKQAEIKILKEQIQELKAKKMTQKAIAEKLNKGLRTIQRYWI